MQKLEALQWPDRHVNGLSKTGKFPWIFRYFWQVSLTVVWRSDTPPGRCDANLQRVSTSYQQSVAFRRFCLQQKSAKPQYSAGRAASLPPAEAISPAAGRRGS